MIRKRNFSLYEIEEFLKETGAEKVEENAVVSFEKELEETVNHLVNQAEFYANYAGRKHIKRSDIKLAKTGLPMGKILRIKKRIRNRKITKNIKGFN